MQGPMLFAPDARNGGVWTQLAGHLHRTLARLEYRRFEDGEHKSRPLDSVRERDVYLLQSFYGDADDIALEATRQEIGAAINAVTDEADARMGHPRITPATRPMVEIGVPTWRENP